MGRTLYNCHPEDIMMYFTAHWLPAHAGTTTKTGHRLVAPGSLSGVKSSLSTELVQLGRTGDWNIVTMQGNLMLSNELIQKRMTKGYKSDAASKEYEQRAAEPIYTSKIKAMLEFLMLKQQMLPSIADQGWTAYQYAVAVVLQRVGELRLESIRNPTNSPAIPFIVPQLMLQPNSQLPIQPGVTKNRKAATALSPSLET